MNRITIREPKTIPGAYGPVLGRIVATDEAAPEVTWEVTKGNYYALRADDDWIIVVRCTGETIRGRPVFSLVEGENPRALGDRQIVVLADYGPFLPQR